MHDIEADEKRYTEPRLASVESPAILGPVTAWPAADIVSCPSFSGKVIFRSRRSIRFMDNGATFRP